MEDLVRELEKDIHTMVMELKGINSASRAYKLICSLRNIEDLVNEHNLDVKYPKEYEYEINKFDYKQYDLAFSQYYYTNALYMKSYGKKLCKMREYFENKYYINDFYFYYNKVKLADSISVVGDFFEKYDKDIFEFYKDTINGRRSYILDLKVEGCSFFANYLTEPLTFIGTNNILEQTLTLAHEIIHSYLSNIQKTVSIDEDATAFINNFDEVYSLFIELVLIDYLKDIRFMERDILSCEGVHASQLLSFLEEYKILNYSDRLNEGYAYGYVLAYHFYDQYLKDKKLGKDNITNFMLESKEHDKIYMLNHYGLNQNDIINPQKIEKYLKKSLIKIPK